jgi:hypothetical protein
MARGVESLRLELARRRTAEASSSNNGTSG